MLIKTVNENNKTVYFVRHAQSTGNEAEVHQTPDLNLSERGVVQATLLAERLARVDFDTILSSPYPRAKQTAEVINMHKKYAIIFSDLLGELKHPSEIIGKSHDSPEIKKIKELVYTNRGNQHYKYSDEESFFERKKRAGEAIKFITSNPDEKILVVTHGAILRTMMAYMIYGEALSATEYSQILFYLHADNVGITQCRYLADEEKWKLITWNDQAHLG